MNTNAHAELSDASEPALRVTAVRVTAGFPPGLETRLGAGNPAVRESGERSTPPHPEEVLPKQIRQRPEGG